MEDQGLCQSCQAMLCGCRAETKDKHYNLSGKLISCNMYMKRVRPGYCENCESGGRL